MNIPKRPVIFAFFVLVILFIGMLNWTFVLNEIIMPVSLVTWLFLRILVLSIDQQYYWAALIIAVLYFLYRLIPQDQSTESSWETGNENETIKSIENWRGLFIAEESNIRGGIILKANLTHMIVSLYATKLHTSPDYKLLDSLRSGEIHLPKNIHVYLFPEEPQKPGRSLRKWLKAIWIFPRQWMRRFTGQEKAEHYRMINEVLSFLENSLEMKDDDGKFNPNQH